MNDDPQLGRAIEAWLADGPHVMPDRVLFDVADRIDRQRQRPAWRLPWRLPTMRTPMFAIAGITLVAVLGIVALVPLGIGGTPSPAPASAAPAASNPPSPTPALASASPVACEDDLPGCAGPLGVGPNRSDQFEPRLFFTTADAWTNVIDQPHVYKLDPAASTESLIAWSGTRVADDCTPTPKAGIGSTATDVLAYVRQHPGLEVSDPVRSTIDGLPATTVDLTVKAGWQIQCADGVRTDVQFLVTAPGDWWYGVAPGMRMRLVLVDESRGTGANAPTLLVFQVYGPSDPAAFKRAVAPAQAVIDSLGIGCGPAAGRACSSATP